jgi:hypothetical protein
MMATASDCAVIGWACSSWSFCWFLFEDDGDGNECRKTKRQAADVGRSDISKGMASALQSDVFGCSSS